MSEYKDFIKYYKNKTRFVDRLFNLNKKICIYDLDGTIIDSSHRARHDKNGKLDLDHWKRNCTKENIFRDDLLPMYWQLVHDYKQGDIIVICTAREMSKYDFQYLHEMGIYYDYIKHRGNSTSLDYKLKRRLLNPFFNLRQFQKLEKFFYDDNQLNLGAISDMGATVVNAKDWNENCGVKM